MAAPNQNGTVASDLTSAAMWGDKELLESLLTNGADPNFPNQQGNSALHEAAFYGELECASILLDHKGLCGRWEENIAVIRQHCLMYRYMYMYMYV